MAASLHPKAVHVACVYIYTMQQCPKPWTHNYARFYIIILKYLLGLQYLQPAIQNIYIQNACEMLNYRSIILLQLYSDVHMQHNSAIMHDCHELNLDLGSIPSIQSTRSTPLQLYISPPHYNINDLFCNSYNKLITKQLHVLSYMHIPCMRMQLSASVAATPSNHHQ